MPTDDHTSIEHENTLPLSVGRLYLLIGEIAPGARVLVQIGNALWSVIGEIDQDGDLLLTPDEVEGRVIRVTST